MEIAEKVKEIIAQQLGVKEDEVVSEADLVDDLGADDLDYVEFVLDFESEFGITIEDEDGEKIKTVGEWITYIEDAK